MDVVESPAAMHRWTRQRRSAGLPAATAIGLVPTMGALHAGHLALIEAARGRGEAVVVSIFVNPLQFNRRDDFDAYPRDLGDDLAQCRDAGVDAVYAPTQQAMYPEGFETRVLPGSLADPLEGAGRPGHFEGVTTVVAKLFNAVQPDFAVFGEKDFQQLTIVRRMVLDLDLPIEIVGHATVREPDGLALSSRNRRLDPAQRAAARVVPTALAETMDELRRSGDPVAAAAAGRRTVEAEPLARLEYLELVHPTTLQPSIAGDPEMVATTAVWFGDVRLIDNRRVHSD